MFPICRGKNLTIPKRAKQLELLSHVKWIRWYNIYIYVNICIYAYRFGFLDLVHFAHEYFSGNSKNTLSQFCGLQRF